MSIVTFDGRSLAADSRVSKSRINPVTKEKEYYHQTDEQVKIELMDGRARFRGETIEAIGRCGNLKLSSRIIETIKAGLLDVEQHWNNAKVYTEFKKTASVLIVTDRNAYHFQVSSVVGVTVKVLEQEPFAMGCGKEVAVFLMTALKLSAQDAAAAVTLTYKSCGGPIRVLKRNMFNGRLELADAKEAKTRAQRQFMVAEATIKAMTRLKTSAEKRIAKHAAKELEEQTQINAHQLITDVLGPPAKPKPAKKAVKQRKVAKAATKSSQRPSFKKAGAAKAAGPLTKAKPLK